MDEMRYQLDLLRAMNQKLGDTEKMYRLITDTSSNVFIYYSFSNNKLEILGAWESFFDFVLEDIKDLSKVLEYVNEKDSIRLRDVLFLEKTHFNNDCIQCKSKDERSWFEYETTVCYDELGKPTDKVIRIKDVTKQRIQNEELTYMAYYDTLTGLYNRNYFVQILGDFVMKAEREKMVVSVMFIDMDDFRKINDSLGIITGDELVQQFGQYLNSFSEENVIVCHMNSDIYCIGIYDPCGSRSVENIHRNIRERAEKGFRLSNGQELSITVSVGVAEYPEAANGALELINCAEIVMFKAKHSGKDAMQYFDALILIEFLQGIEIENKLKCANYDKDFYVYFQPQYYALNQRLRGVEALIRWQDEDTFISPSIFIPIAEKNGTITAIGTWVIEESLRNYAEWKRKYGYPMILSINISAIQYKKIDFVDILLELLGKYEVNPKEVELEITESILIDDFEEVKEKLHTLREYGIRVSLDDFGTGFSSLSYLKGLPIDTLKIDKTFIDDLSSDDASKIITNAIIEMVQNLGFETVAEGVETKEQLDCLKGMHCDVIQGFLLGKPMPASEIEKLLIHLL